MVYRRGSCKVVHFNSRYHFLYYTTSCRPRFRASVYFYLNKTQLISLWDSVGLYQCNMFYNQFITVLLYERSKITISHINFNLKIIKLISHFCKSRCPRHKLKLNIEHKNINASKPNNTLLHYLGTKFTLHVANTEKVNHQYHQ